MVAAPILAALVLPPFLDTDLPEPVNFPAGIDPSPPELPGPGSLSFAPRFSRGRLRSFPKSLPGSFLNTARVYCAVMLFPFEACFEVAEIWF